MDSTHRWTKAQLAEMEEHLSEIYAEANGDIEKKLFDHLEKFKKLDEMKRAAVEKARRQGAENAEELAKERERWRRTQIFQGQNWRNKLSELTRQYLEVNKTALAYVNGEMPKIAARNYNAFEDEANEAAEKYGMNEYSFSLVDERTVKKLATENETLLPYKVVDGQKDERWNTKQINAQMLQGILQGEDIPTIASRLQNVTEMNRESAVRNARTMTTSAECAGRQMSYIEAEKDGMIIEREWLCTADNRRRDWHWALNGTFAKVNNPWENDFGKIMYPGDPNAAPQNVYNCRCSIAAKVVGFGKVDEAELAADIAKHNAEQKTVNAQEAEKLKQRLAAEKSAKKLTSSKKNSIIKSGARITDVFSKEAEEHAEKYYEEIRHFKTDCEKIAKNTGKKAEEIRKIKKYLFEDDSFYDSEEEVWKRFEPDFAIAQSWQRLTAGKGIKKHDLTLIEHELYEMQLKQKEKLQHYEAHALATKKYNYQKESEEYYANLAKHKKK